MKRITLLLVGVATLACVVVFTATTSRHVTAQEAAPIFIKKIPPATPAEAEQVERETLRENDTRS